MKLLFIFSLLVSSVTVYSQNGLFRHRSSEDVKQKLLSDSLAKNYPDLKLNLPNSKIYSFKPGQKVPGDGSVVKIPLKGQFIGNNGSGGNIYSMQPYNMTCLVPDSTFSSNMPIAGSLNLEENNKLFEKAPENRDNKLNEESRE